MSEKQSYCSLVFKNQPVGRGYLSGDGVKIEKGVIRARLSETLRNALKISEHGLYVPEMPVGTILSMMRKTPPEGYLVCDGSELEEADYPELAAMFLSEFGNKQFFGGSGTKFAVPDMRGNFQRMTGPASQGSAGAAVGVKQEGTDIPNIYTDGNGAIIGPYINGRSSVPRVSDGWVNIGNTYRYTFGTNVDLPSTSEIANGFKARPDNISVLFCIKY